MGKTLFVNITSLLIFYTFTSCTPQAEDYLDDPSIKIYDYSEDVLWTKRDNLNIYGILYTPIGVDDKMPVAIMSHGFNGSHKNCHGYAEAMAQIGYLTYAFDFCGAGTRSKSDGKSTEMSIITERNDLEAVIDYFKSRPDVDTSRICLMGDSQGGMVTALAAAERANEIESICLFYPALCIPNDWNEKFGSIDNVPETYQMGHVTLGSVYFTDAWSLIGNVYNEISKFKGKVLLIHGDNDKTVPIAYSDTANMAYENCEYHVIQGAGHGFKGNYRKKSLKYTLQFMTNQ